MKQSSNQPRSPRQLKVGEELRHALSSVFMRGDYRIHELDGTSITVSEVRISPDLSNATAYVMPLAGKDANHVVETLNRHHAQFRKLVSERVKLRHAPTFRFKVDETFDEAAKIAALLKPKEDANDAD
ncbi:MAG: 30S ribosome-binding factor RbfA [Rickettsiales bacterium]